MLVSSEDVERSGMQGKGVDMLHLYQDKLWYISLEALQFSFLILRNREAGSKQAHPLIQDEGIFNSESLEPTEEDLQTKIESASEAEAESKQENPQLAENKDATTVLEEKKTDEQEIRRPPPSEDEITAQDNLLRYCFFTAIKGGAEKKLRDKDLPILANIFFSDYILPARPEGATLEIKRTSYKKLNAFLSEASGKGLIQTNETSPGVLQITAINRAHDEYYPILCNSMMSS